LTCFSQYSSWLAHLWCVGLSWNHTFIICSDMSESCAVSMEPLHNVCNTKTGIQYISQKWLRGKAPYSQKLMCPGHHSDAWKWRLSSGQKMLVGSVQKVPNRRHKVLHKRHPFKVCYITCSTDVSGLSSNQTRSMCLNMAHVYSIPYMRMVWMTCRHSEWYKQTVIMWRNRDYSGRN